MSGLWYSGFPDCPLGAGCSPMHEGGNAQEGLPTEGKVPTSRTDLGTWREPRSSQGLPYPLPLSLGVGLILMSTGHSYSRCDAGGGQGAVCGISKEPHTSGPMVS